MGSSQSKCAFAGGNYVLYTSLSTPLNGWVDAPTICTKFDFENRNSHTTLRLYLSTPAFFLSMLEKKHLLILPKQKTVM